MMLDPDLALIVLRVLAMNAGNGPITEELVGLGYQAKAHKPPIASRIRAALDECKRQRWAVETQDEFGQPVWAVTPAGADRDKQP
jgi:hypothetical protein